jgi:hypothetical protein
VNASAAARVRLEAMPPEIAIALADDVARIDPWRRLAVCPQSLACLFTATPANSKRLITLDGRPAGTVIIQPNWLLGPYLQHLSVLPEAQQNGAGTAALAWLEDVSRAAG